MDSTDTTSAPEPELNLTSRLIDEWAKRVKAIGLKRGTQLYNRMHMEWWLGASVAAEAVGQPLGRGVAVYIITQRDMLDYEAKGLDADAGKTRA
jgi:hypothetical protein